VNVSCQNGQCHIALEDLNAMIAAHIEPLDFESIDG
jgi:hypothetical protein